MAVDLNEQLAWRLSNEESLRLLDAPDLAEDIWHKYQLKQVSKLMLMLCVLVVVGMSFWLRTAPNAELAMPDYIANSHEYERELAKFKSTELTDAQQAIVANWYHELSVIDQTIERGKGNLYNEKLWQRRTNILKIMVEFYTQPLDLYEI
ncbi:hypothetical protein ACFSJY_15895 [Thalassotalea euphylliae]|uniref:hypothetical protein n=1 Tax=Thalassotalea euphylliae TaxID=1655234 RepID=UPI00362DAB3A